MKKNITETDINRLVKKVISEQTEKDRYEPISIEFIKDYIRDGLKVSFGREIELSDRSVRRRVKNFDKKVEQLAKQYYDGFISQLVYMTEDGQWKDFLEDLGMYDD
jgi:hypothetical protein